MFRLDNLFTALAYVVVIAIIIIGISDYSNAQPKELEGHSIAMGMKGVYVADFKTFTWDEWEKFIEDNNIDPSDVPFEKAYSYLYRCASNNWINTNMISPIYTDEQRKQMAVDVFNATYSDIWQVNKEIKSKVSVYFEISGSGFSVAEKKALEKDIQDAIQKVLDKHFDQ